MALHSSLVGADIHETKLTVLSNTPVILNTVASAAGVLVLDNTGALWKANSTAAGDWSKPTGASGGNPTGPAGGSLSGTYPNPAVATNANLTGDVTSVGNATTLTNIPTLSGANLTGTAPSLTAGNATLATTVTTNANLTGPITSVGNATTIVGPLPAISGAALTSLTAANISAGTAGISISGNAATVTTNANLTGDVTSVGNATTVNSVGGSSASDINTVVSTAIGGFSGIITPSFTSITVVDGIITAVS
jgi:hypothetical protein